LRSAAPSRFEDGLLTITFPASAAMQKRMLERNGRIEQIQSFLIECCPRLSKVIFETASAEQREAEPATPAPKTGSQKRNELINNPAVKMVLIGLDATVTGIEEE
jgi:hypothetical protein